MKYNITADYIKSGTKRRSGTKMGKMQFIVSHDTGNPNSTAKGNVNYYKNSANEISASAHIFVDDKDIIECVPLLTGTPEKAWHVRYNVTTDNKLFGANANDVAGGIEYCYGSKINADEAYKRYVWVIAYTFYKMGVDPSKLTAHYILDPERKTDPKSGLAQSGRTFEQLKKDVIAEYKECTTATTNTTVKKEETKVIAQWKKDALKNLSTQKQVNGDPMMDYNEWVDKLDDNIPVWLLVVMINRLLAKVGGK